MSTTIRRRGTNARKTAAAQGAAKKVRRAKATTGSLLGRAFAWVPLEERHLHRVLAALVLAIALALAWAVAKASGAAEFAADKLAQAAAGAGFEVRHVEVRGVRNMNALKVYERVLGERDRAMSRVDLAGLRGDLLALGWVKDARVSRQLPDTLVVDIVERSPRGVLREPDGRLMLIDETGHALEPIAPGKLGGWLVVAGAGASQRVVALDALLRASPGLRRQVREAEWVGERRWNLTFRSGQVLALPEGDEPARAALSDFARLDGETRLLGGRVAAIDMRSPDRTYLRIPGLAQEQQQAAAAAARAKATR